MVTFIIFAYLCWTHQVPHIDTHVGHLSNMPQLYTLFFNSRYLLTLLDTRFVIYFVHLTCLRCLLILISYVKDCTLVKKDPQNKF